MKRCPRCGKEAAHEGNPSRPFCSERCRLLDLGNWLSGSYAIPTVEGDETEDESAPPTKGHEQS